MPLMTEAAIEAAMASLATDPLIPPDLNVPKGQIFAAASKLFSENGYHGTNTRAIAEAAGVKQVMVHYYFGSKEMLYEAVLKYESVRMLAEVFESTSDLEASAELLVEAPLRLMNVLHENPQWASLLRREIAEGAVHLKRALRGIPEQGPLGNGDKFTQAYREAAREGLVADLPSEAVRECLLAISYCSIYLTPLIALMNNRDIQDKKVWEELTTTLRTILTKGLLIKNESA